MCKCEELKEDDWIDDVDLPPMKSTNGIILDFTTQLKNLERSSKFIEFDPSQKIRVQEVPGTKLAKVAKLSIDRYKNGLKFKRDAKEAERMMKQKRDDLNNINFNDKGKFRKSIRKFKKMQKDKIYDTMKILAETHASIEESECAWSCSKATVFHNGNKIRELNSLIIQQIQAKNEIVKSLDINALSKFRIPNIHNKANDVFIWVIQCIYQESQASYWWDNFKKCVFVEDNGVDYKNRLLGHDRRTFGEKEGFLTDKLLEDKQTIIACFKEVGNVDGADKSFEKHFQIAEHLNTIYKHYKSLKKMEAENTEHNLASGRLESIIKDHRKRLNGLLEIYSAIQLMDETFSHIGQFVSFWFQFGDNYLGLL